MNCLLGRLEEEMLVKSVIKTYDSPTGYHLLLAICNANMPLVQELVNDGIDLNLFRKNIEDHLKAAEDKLFHEGEFQPQPLIDTNKIIFN